MKTKTFYLNTLTLALVCLHSITAFAQGFQKHYRMGSSNGYSEIIDGDELVVAGSTAKTERGDNDMLLMKTDLSGTLIWAKAIGGSKNDVAYRIKKTSDNGYIMVGTTSSFKPTNNSNFYIVKTDRDGNIKWTRIIGRNQANIANDVIEKADHTYAVVGTTTSATNTNILFMTFDANGTLLLSREIGESGDETGNGLVETFGGNCLIVGSTTSFGFKTSGQVPYLVMVSPTGSVLSGYTYVSNSTLSSSKRYFTKISKGYDHSFVITGSDGLGVSPVFDAQAMLMNIDSTGNVNWATRYILNSGQGVGSSVEQALNEKYIIGGTMGFDIPALILTDKTGARVESKIYPGVSIFNGRGWDAVDNQNHSIIFVASSGSVDSAVYLIRTDENLSSQVCQERDAFIDQDISMTMDVQPRTFLNYSNPDSYFNDSTTVRPVSLITTICTPNSVAENQAVKDGVTVQQSFSSVEFKLKNTSDVIRQVSIYNLLGARIKEVNIIQNQSISTADLPAGSYIYQVITSQKEVFNGKFVIH